MCSEGEWSFVDSIFIVNNNKQKRRIQTVCVGIHLKPKTFEEASKICKDQGGYLVGPDTNHIQPGAKLRDKIGQEKAEYLKNNGIWLNIFQGATKIFIDGKEPIELGSIYNNSLDLRIRHFDLHTDCPYIRDAQRFFSQKTTVTEVSSTSCASKNAFFCEREASATANLIQNTTLCDEGWYYSANDNHCYRFFPQKTNLADAEEICSSNKASLSCPQSIIENILISKTALFNLKLFGCQYNSPCKNGGRCIFNEKGFLRCDCPKEFQGDHCQIPSSSVKLKTYTTCPAGRFLLPHCTMICKCQYLSACDDVNGECPELKCEKGWYGRQCNIYSPIPNTWLGIKNDRSDLHCSNGQVVSKNLYYKFMENVYPGSCVIANEMAFIRGKYWKSVDCNEKNYFVCKKSVVTGNLNSPVIDDTKNRSLNDTGLRCEIPKSLENIPKSIFWNKDGDFLIYKNIYEAKGTKLSLMEVSFLCSYNKE